MSTSVCLISSMFSFIFKKWQKDKHAKNCSKIYPFMIYYQQRFNLYTYMRLCKNWSNKKVWKVEKLLEAILPPSRPTLPSAMGAWARLDCSLLCFELFCLLPVSYTLMEQINPTLWEQKSKSGLQYQCQRCPGTPSSCEVFCWNLIFLTCTWMPLRKGQDTTLLSSQELRPIINAFASFFGPTIFSLYL